MHRLQYNTVLVTLLFRYKVHRDICLGQQLRAGAPLRILCASLSCKWDETQQRVNAEDKQDANLPSRPGGGPRSRSGVALVMVAGISVKTDLMSSPIRWVTEPLHLQRNTADCMWQGLQKLAPFGPFTEDGFSKVSPERCQWVWIILTADSASANLRLEMHAFHECRRLRPEKTLFLSLPCIVHSCHRAALPVLKNTNITSNLYRMAHVWNVDSFWSGLKASVHRRVRSMVIKHHGDQPREHDRQVARQLLQLTLAAGCSANRLPESITALIDEWLSVMTGDWKSETLVYHCQTPECRGGHCCEKKAVDHVMGLLHRGLHSSVLQIPTTSRWWKVAPTARKALLGVAFHRIWPKSAPQKLRKDDPDFQPGPDLSVPRKRPGSFFTVFVGEHLGVRKR